jgi:hypothetical protein
MLGWCLRASSSSYKRVLEASDGVPIWHIALRRCPAICSAIFVEKKNGSGWHPYCDRVSNRNLLEVCYVALVQLLSLRAPRVRHVVRTGSHFPTVHPLRPPLFRMVAPRQAPDCNDSSSDDHDAVTFRISSAASAAVRSTRRSALTRVPRSLFDSLRTGRSQYTRCRFPASAKKI